MQSSAPRAVAIGYDHPPLLRRKVASNSKITNYYLNPGKPLMQHIAAQSPGQIHVDPGKLWSYLQVPDFQVYVSLGVNKSTIFRRWYDGLMVYGAAALVASLALLSVSWMAIQRAKSEREALAQLNSGICSTRD